MCECLLQNEVQSQCVTRVQYVLLYTSDTTFLGAGAVIVGDAALARRGSVRDER